MELPINIYRKIIKYAKKGDYEFDAGNFDMAILYYDKALELLPRPINRWETGLWLYAALGDAYYMISNYIKSLEFFNKALIEYEEYDNPFILLRVGECNYELGNLNKARKYFLQAFCLEGKELFETEDEKYIKLLNKEIS